MDFYPELVAVDGNGNIAVSCRRTLSIAPEVNLEEFM